jgi:hypothetical protein
MADYFGQVTGDQDFFKKILTKIPGFSGYVDRQNRRSADKLLRDTIADHFESLWQRISSLQRDMLSAGGIENLDDVEVAALKIRQFIDRIRSASYGYAGFFDALKIGTKELSVIYQYDLQLLTMEDEVSRAIDNLASSLSNEGQPEATRYLVSISQQCIDAFEKRKEAVLNCASGSADIPTTPMKGS